MPNIYFPFPLNTPNRENQYYALKQFLQEVVDALAVGALRYEKMGLPCSRKRYMTRMRLELEHYEKTGNRMQLINLFAYTFLESYAPENKRFHFDNTVDSVTREKVGA